MPYHLSAINMAVIIFSLPKYLAAHFDLCDSLLLNIHPHLPKDWHLVTLLRKLRVPG